MSQAGMTLTKWSSSHSVIGKEHTGAEDLKILGIQWNPEIDSFLFKGISIPTATIVTKRLVLSSIARIYDPLGFIQPLVITAKILFQEMWRQGIEWDMQAPDDLSHSFHSWLKDLEDIKELSIPRKYSSVKFKENIQQLVVFCDASEMAYGAVVYVEIDDKFSFVVSRARVAPLKKVTLPRLELLACLIGARLLNEVKVALSLKEAEYQCYTDSKIALAWIQNSPDKWKPFVANRVQSIQEHTDPSKWHHVPGTSNPADLLTRGLKAKQMKEAKMWMQGPDIQFDHSDQTVLTSIETAEVGEEMMMTATVTDAWIQPTRWGSLVKAVRVIAWVKRFIHNCRHQCMRNKESNLSQEEMSSAKVELLRHAQTEVFKEEIEVLRAKKNIPKSSKLHQLSCYLDEEGLLRIKGRLDNSDLSFDSKHPVVLPNCWISRLIVLDYHSSMKHAGVSTIVNAIREKYWILNLRRITKSVIKSCVPCQRLAAKSCNQETGPLPAERVNKKNPFSSTGIDYAGPLYVSDSTEKHYICLFTCMITRAVHLELTPSLSVEDFLLAFRRFTARRGLPESIISDNAKTFLSASNRLEKMYGDRRPKWSFIAPRSPWRGGVWERMVRTVKTLIRRTVGKLCLSRSELDTLLAEVEFVVNSRPITAVTDGPDDFKGITPNDFLMFHGAIDTNRAKESLAKNNRRLQQVWTLWTNAYLKQLPSGVPQFKERCNLKINSIVLIREDHLPRLQWPLGRIIELLPGKDNKIRTVKLQTASGVRIRSVQRLHHLESVTPQLDTVNGDPDVPRDPSVVHVSNPSSLQGGVMKKAPSPNDKPRISRAGRFIKSPTKLIYE